MPSRIALWAASRMCSGVSKSGSPTVNSRTGLPSRASARARALAAMVGDGAIVCSRSLRAGAVRTGGVVSGIRSPPVNRPAAAGDGVSVRPPVDAQRLTGTAMDGTRATGRLLAVVVLGAVGVPATYVVRVQVLVRNDGLDPQVQLAPGHRDPVTPEDLGVPAVCAGLDRQWRLFWPDRLRRRRGRLLIAQRLLDQHPEVAKGATACSSIRLVARRRTCGASRRATIAPRTIGIHRVSSRCARPLTMRHPGRRTARRSFRGLPKVPCAAFPTPGAPLGDARHTPSKTAGREEGDGGAPPCQSRRW